VTLPWQNGAERADTSPAHTLTVTRSVPSTVVPDEIGQDRATSSARSDAAGSATLLAW
jgi:hypothetical protein